MVLKYLSDTVITRFFHDEPLAASLKHICYHLHGMLLTAGDDDLRRIALHIPGSPQIPGDLPAERKFSCSVGISHDTGRLHLAQRIVKAPPPLFVRKHAVVHRTIGKIVSHMKLILSFLIAVSGALARLLFP